MIRAIGLSIFIYLSLVFTSGLIQHIRAETNYHPTIIADKIPIAEVVKEKELPVFDEIPTCASEIKKYSWNQTVAYNVMQQESGGNASINVDDSDDDSVGCFQINLQGESNMNEKYGLAVSLGYQGAYSRDELVTWLQNASNNVAVAYTMWSRSGWQPWSFHTCKVVACY